MWAQRGVAAVRLQQQTVYVRTSLAITASSSNFGRAMKGFSKLRVKPGGSCDGGLDCGGRHRANIGQSNDEWKLLLLFGLPPFLDRGRLPCGDSLANDAIHRQCEIPAPGSFALIEYLEMSSRRFGCADAPWGEPGRRPAVRIRAADLKNQLREINAGCANLSDWRLLQLRFNTSTSGTSMPRKSL